LECNLARSVWTLERENITEFLSQVHWTDARAWLAEVMNSIKHAEVTRVVVRMWAVWYARRKAIHMRISFRAHSRHIILLNASSRRLRRLNKGA
jgi:hypothetical protein